MVERMTMQDAIKRYFWVATALTVVVCALLFAKAVGYFVAGKYLGDARVSPAITVVRSDNQASQRRSKDGSMFATRNMFCASCTPTAAAVVEVDPSKISNTSLPLVLLATHVGIKPSFSFASITTADGRPGAFYVDDRIPDAGIVKEIRYQYVEFLNTANGRVERLTLGGAEIARPAVAAAPTAAADPAKDGLAAEIDAGIKKVDDSNYEISRSLVTQIMANPMAIAKDARLNPIMKNGKAEGFRVNAIKPNSAIAKIGLRNGDQLKAINGLELTSMEAGLTMYQKLRESTSIEVEVVRGGKPVTLNYSIR